MSLKYGLLGFLSSQEMSGYDLEKLFSKSIGFFWHAQISQVYRDLKSMEKSGWVKSKEVIQTGKPNKKIFNITTQGRQALEDWLIGYDVKGDFEVRVGILVRMFFAANRPKSETIRILETYKSKCEEAMAALSHVPKEFDCEESLELIYVKSTLSYGQKFYQMGLAWSSETIETLKNANFEERNDDATINN